MRYFDSEYYGDNVRWFMGVAKSTRNDPLKLGRIRVRIFGLHSDSIEDIRDEDLPWAPIVLASNVPSSPSNYQAFGINDNDIVYGVFTDGKHSQQPLVLGVVPTNKTYAAVWNDPDVSTINEDTSTGQSQTSDSGGQTQTTDSSGQTWEGGYPEIKTGLITTSNGLKTSVALEYVPNFQGLIDDLEATGYVIKSLGGYNRRKIAKTDTPSWHAFGMAIDINPATNGVYYGARDPRKTDMPSNTAAISKKHGIGWGDLWTGNKKDPMHFSMAKNEGGSVQKSRKPPTQRPAPKASNVGGSNNQERAFKYLTKAFIEAGSKYPQQQAAGFVGNLMAESGPNINPELKAAGSENSWGIAQWNGSRAAGNRLGKLQKFAASKGKDWKTLDIQLEYIVHELYSGEVYGSAGRITMNSLIKKTDIDSSAEYIMMSYENPQVAIDYKNNRVAGEKKFRAELNKRIGFAKEVYNRYTRGTE